MSVALNSALRTLCYLGSLFDIWMFLLGLHICDHAVLPSIRPLGFVEGGINDPPVYMYCCG